MRKRRKSISQWVFFSVGLVLLAVFGVASVPVLVRGGWLQPEWQDWVTVIIESARWFMPSEDQLRFLAWLGGIAGSLVGAAVTLLAGWHFAEMNLPQRIEDLKNSNSSDHLLLQPRFLGLARQGLGSIPADIETSRLTLLRKWLSGWSEREQARVLAASSNQLARQAAALSAAAREAQQQQITAHLVRGYQHASDRNDDKAFDEFEAATKVRSDDVLSRDIAAGCARRTNKQEKEFKLLKEMQQAAISKDSKIDQARALRREAELLDKRRNLLDWRHARNRLDRARSLLQPLLPDEEAKAELVRVLTLFCEVQCERGVVRQLLWPNGALTQLRVHVGAVRLRRRQPEQGGDEYDRVRVESVDARVTELLSDPDAQSDQGSADGGTTPPTSTQ